MKLLLDTCTFLWVVAGDPSLAGPARDAIVDPGNDVYLSVISAWEIAIKQARGRLTLAEPAQRYVPKYRRAHGYEELALDEQSALRIGQLPAAHKDPFDRMLVCQAITHGMAIVTPDPLIAQYPVRTIW
ncbi:MAG: type II toxin-antitoxin system VapC family toxin [Betaproteobacteria bacterium]|nr:type II toxin-antitoxin system VapC family toxin [Betaproteobacteria bacterium]